MNTDTAATIAVLLSVVLVAHDLGDQWVQTHTQACGKGRAGWVGRRACAAHVATYTALTAGVIGLLWASLHLPISPTGFLAGQLVSAVSHYWADRRTPLMRIAQAIGKGDYYHLGQPRPGRDDNLTTGTGAYALDQAWHRTWLVVAMWLTAVIR